MASITFSGQLDQAMNELAAEGNKILFIPHQTVGEVLPGAASELFVESDGTYDITLAYNTYSIYHYSDVTKRKTLIATDVVVSADTLVTTIPDLIGSTVPVTEDSVLIIQGYLTDASNYASSAESSAEIAASYASIAQSAASVASTSAGIFDSTSDGISGTSDGDYFSVISSYDNTYVDLYLNDGGSASFIDSYPNKNAIDEVSSVIDGDGPNGSDGDETYQLAITDGVGRIALYADEDGNFTLTTSLTNLDDEIEERQQFDQLLQESINSTSETVDSITNTLDSDGPIGSDGTEYAFAITDSNGFVINSVSNDGEVTNLETTTYKSSHANNQQSTVDSYGQISSSTGLDGSNTITTVSFEEQPDNSNDFVIVDSYGRECLRVDEYGAVDMSPTKYSEFVQAQDMFIESYGQSLSKGASCNAVVSTSQEYSNVMFESGVRYDADQVLTSYTPLIELLDGSDGETPCSGITNYLSSSDDNYTTNDTRYIGSASGLGGQPIANLIKGKTIYNRLKARIQAGYDLSVSEGRSFNVPCIYYTQAEADYVAGTEPEVWKSELIQLHNDLNVEFREITGQTFKAPMFFYQCATNRNRGVDYPSLALVQGSFDGQNDMFCACAMYNFNYADDLHLEAESYYRLGWYYGKAFDNWKNTGEVKCLRIKGAITYGTFIDVWLDVPVGPVVIDTDQVTETDGYGFIIYDQNKDPILDIVSSVEVTGVDRLKINLTETVEKGKYLTYAFGDGSEGTVSGATAGPRGNIRDSQGDTMTITDQAGNVSRGDNWLLISEVLLK